MIEVINNQRKIKINNEIWHEFALQATKIFKKSRGKNLNIVFLSDRKMRKYNREFRGKNATTDVLSFPHQQDEFDFEETYNNLGDIVISVEQAQKQAAENNLLLELEIRQLILHGILHLCGYDHETDSGKMNRLELKLRDKLGIS
jgi:probable rRNA maturation factor